MSFLQNLTSLFPTEPLQILQFGIGAGTFLLLFLLLFTLRDILLRTKSFWYQFLSVLLVGAFPLGGFLLYLLIRPARTVKERETERMLKELLGEGGENLELDLSEFLDLGEEQEESEGGEDQEKEGDAEDAKKEPAADDIAPDSHSTDRP